MVSEAEKVKVLIVDDEVEFLKSISKALSRRDLVVRTAENGAEALEILARQSFDVVLLDMKMPGMSGEETLLPHLSAVATDCSHSSNRTSFNTTGFPDLQRGRIRLCGKTV